MIHNPFITERKYKSLLNYLYLNKIFKNMTAILSESKISPHICKVLSDMKLIEKYEIHKWKWIGGVPNMNMVKEMRKRTNADVRRYDKRSRNRKNLNKFDIVNNPKHYTDGKIEVIDFIEDKNLCYHLGQVIKYVSRAGKKDPKKTTEDLLKAQWYLNRKIQQLEKIK